MKPTNHSQAPMSISDEALDQLVGGTLSRDNYRSLLLDLEAEPARWRDCALAFLREQALEIELKSLAAGNINWEARATALRTDPIKQTSSELAASELSASRFTVGCNRLVKTAANWLALAGILLIGFGGGWTMGNWGKRSSRGSSTNELETSKLAAGEQATGRRTDHLQLPETSLSEPLPTVRLVDNTPEASDANRASTRASAQSAVDKNSVRFVSEQFVPIDRQMPPQLRELERLGHVRIETLDAIMPINLDDGTAAIVPVQQYRIRPMVFSF